MEVNCVALDSVRFDIYDTNKIYQGRVVQLPGDTLAGTPGAPCTFALDTIVAYGGDWLVKVNVWFGAGTDSSLSYIDWKTTTFSALDTLLDDAPHSPNYGGTGGGDAVVPCSLWIFNSADSAVIQGASVSGRLDSDGTTPKGTLTSDANGLAVFSWTDGISYDVLVNHNNYQATSTPALDAFPCSTVTSRSAVYLVAFAPTLTDSAGMTTVYGTLWVQGVRMANARVVFTQNQMTTSGTNIHIPRSKAMPTDSNGYFEGYVWPSSLTGPVGDSISYKVEVFSGEESVLERATVWIPDTTSIQITNCSGFDD